jgi:glycosyltransferase involved in cell wall biosynthesis
LLIREPRKGHTIATNTGIAHAQGEYISLIGSDDVLHREKLTKQLRALSAQDAQVNYTDGWEINSAGQPVGHTFHRDILSSPRGAFDLDVFHELLRFGFKEILGASILVCRDCLVNEPFDTRLRFFDDWDLWVRLARRYRFSYIAEPLYGYRVYEGNNWTNLSKRSLQEIEIALYENWMQIFNDLDKDSKNIIVENLVKRYMYLHNRRAMLKLGLSHSVAFKLLAKRLAASFSYRASHLLR